MRDRTPRPGQIGEFWISKKPGRTGANDPWCRTWYDKSARQTRHDSLGTSDVHEATTRLSTWFELNNRPLDAAKSEVMIEKVLMVYWQDYASRLPSAASVFDGLAIWQEFWTGKTVDDITAIEQDRFVAWIQKKRPGIKSSSIDRILACGRAALNRAVKRRELQSAPHIFMRETQNEREARPRRGRPISLAEMAKFLNAIREPRLLIFTVILVGTFARSAAILELRRKQFDKDKSVLALNPEGCIQTTKRRPTILVCPTLARWLSCFNDPEGYYVTCRDRPMRSVRGCWSVTLKTAGLEKVNRYSFRHGMAEELRLRGVGLEDLGIAMGHKDADYTTTKIYAPDKPEHMKAVANAVQSIFDDIQKHLNRIDLRNPIASLAQLAEERPQGKSNRLSYAARSAMIEKIKAGVSIGKIRAEFGVSHNAIYKHQKRLGIYKRAKRVPAYGAKFGKLLQTKSNCSELDP